MQEHAETMVDVTCPHGSAEGAVIQVAFGDSTFDVTVPVGISEGEAFQVMLPVAADAPVADMEDVLAAMNVVLDALEDHDDDVLDNIVDGNCSDFAEWEKGSEAKLEWHELFMRYVQEVEGFIGEVLTSINTTPERVFEEAARYNGSDERVQKLITRLLATEVRLAPRSMSKIDRARRPAALLMTRLSARNAVLRRTLRSSAR